MLINVLKRDSKDQDRKGSIVAGEFWDGTG